MDAYGGEGGWLCNIYAYGCLWCMWVGGSIISKCLRMLTVGMGGWVGNIYMLTDAYVGGLVGGFVKIRCLRNIWTAPNLAPWLDFGSRM